MGRRVSTLTTKQLQFHFFSTEIRENSPERYRQPELDPRATIFAKLSPIKRKEETFNFMTQLRPTYL